MKNQKCNYILENSDRWAVEHFIDEQLSKRNSVYHNLFFGDSLRAARLSENIIEKLFYNTRFSNEFEGVLVLNLSDITYQDNYDLALVLRAIKSYILRANLIIYSEHAIDKSILRSIKSHFLITGFQQQKQAPNVNEQYIEKLKSFGLSEHDSLKVIERIKSASLRNFQTLFENMCRDLSKVNLTGVSYSEVIDDYFPTPKRKIGF